MPLYLGHVQCDRLAVETKEIVPASNVTFFTTDYAFAPCTEADGQRLLTPIDSFLRQLGSSCEFHAKRTRTPSTGNLGSSWREVPWGNLHLPTVHTPWDSKKAFDPALRNSMDHKAALVRLEGYQQLKRSVLFFGKHVTITSPIKRHLARDTKHDES